MTLPTVFKRSGLLLLLTGLTYPLSSFRFHGRTRQSLDTIVIDPGHGGFDPGCSGLFSKEKDVTLAISLKLGQAIQEAFPDMKIIYTRTTDVMPGDATTIRGGLTYRADMANKAKGDLFLCIHANSNGHHAGTYEQRRITGYKWVKKGKKKKKMPVYDYSTVKNTKVGTATYVWKAMWGAYKGSAINQKDIGEEGGEDMGDSTTAPPFSSDSREGRLRAQLYEKKYFANSTFFGTLVQNEFIKSGRVSEGVNQRQVGIWVLEATGMPSVLIETGYLTNEEEEKYLNSEGGQDEVVANIIDALKHYKDSLEGVHTE